MFHASHRAAVSHAKNPVGLDQLTRLNAADSVGLAIAQRADFQVVSLFNLTYHPRKRGSAGRRSHGVSHEGSSHWSCSVIKAAVLRYSHFIRVFPFIRNFNQKLSYEVQQ